MSCKIRCKAVVNGTGMGFGLLDLEYVPMGASVVSMATHRLSRLLRNELGELLISHGQVGLPRWRILAILAAEGEIPQKELTQLTKIEQGQISRALALMEEEKLVVSRRSSEDKRSRLFALTQKGREEYDGIFPVVSALSRAIDSALSADEQKLFLSMSERIAQATVQASEFP
jgi:DNA-binding MarR family transcriptional regulator